jgi:hypothetical protein
MKMQNKVGFILTSICIISAYVTFVYILKCSL